MDDVATDRPTDRPFVSIAILNNEHAAEAIEMIRSARSTEPELFKTTEWLLLHNGSDPPPQESDVGPRVTIRTLENRGYGGGFNQAALWTSGDYILALNADIGYEEGFLAATHAVARELEEEKEVTRIGVVGFRLLNSDRTLQGSAGRFPTLTRFLLSQCRPRATRKYLQLPLDRASDVPWVTGACLLVARRCFEDLGGFDESFFMYYEDVDLCHRCWKSGWRVVFDPRPALRHLHPYHARRLTMSMVHLSRPSLLRYFLKHRPGWESFVIGQVIRIECWWRQWWVGEAERESWKALARQTRHILTTHRNDRSAKSKSPADVLHPLPKE